MERILVSFRFEWKKPMIMLKNKHIGLAFFLVFLFAAVGCNRFHTLQRTQIVSVFHLIETNRFSEAKGVVEEMVQDENIAQWPRIWYARGVLAQTAFRQGTRTNDNRLLNLYPNQLDVVYESFQKAILLDSSASFKKNLLPRFIQLANDYALFGERQFNQRNFSVASAAFERSLRISETYITSAVVDTALLYNAGLAAMEARFWTSAIRNFERLHKLRVSPYITNLLHKALISHGDSLNAERILLEGLTIFPANEPLVRSITELYLLRGKGKGALNILKHAAETQPEVVSFHNLQGFVYQKSGQNQQAIDAFKRVVALDSTYLNAYINIATAFYNMGVEIDEATRTITNIQIVRQERERANEAFSSAIHWLDQVYASPRRNQDINQALLQLYRRLRVQDRVVSLEAQTR